MPVLISLLFTCAGALALSGPTKKLKGEEKKELCPHIRFENIWITDFSSLEKTLACGSESEDSKSWSKVPLNQARLFLTGFLQKRSFHNPNFREQDGLLFVDPGRSSRIRVIEYRGMPSEIDPRRKWDLEGEPLQSASLDRLDEWSRTQLREHGYPCATVKLRADPDTETVRVDIDPGPKKQIHEIHERLEGALEPGVLSRFYAFRKGDTYNSALINLTRNRIAKDGIVQNVFLDASCSRPAPTPHAIDLDESVVAGPTNLVTAGAGGSLEQGPEVKVSWQKSRTDKLGSSVSLSSTATLRNQRIEGLLKHYWFQTAPRFYTQPQIALSFEREKTYSSRDLTAHYYLGYQWDTSAQSTALKLGPSWRTTWSNRNELSTNSRIISMELHARLTTHAYELFLGSPRSGGQVQMDAIATGPELASDIRAQKITLHGHYLWNYRDFDPPKFITALRWSFGTTFTPAAMLHRLPPDFLFYLGGSDNLRAFERRSEPDDGSPRLSSAYIGAEFRWYKLLFRRFDPFLLADWAQLGSKSAQLNTESYFDYGFGARWETGFGTLRGYLARGEIFARHPEAGPIYRVGLSFGEEF